MILNMQPGLIALEYKRDIHTIEDLKSYYWEFFDATGYEHHLLRNEKVFKTVISNGIYSGIYAENDIYQLELNRRLMDMAWLYLECLENSDETVEPYLPQNPYMPKLHYQYESTYYYEQYSGVVRLHDENRPDPFRAEKDYKKVIARFKGEVRWLRPDEISHPHWLYEQLFNKRTYPQWLEVLDTWAEYTLIKRSICEKLDGGDVYDTFVFFQKLTEMAHLLYTGRCKMEDPD
ncbi:MAG TPA: hypothetical protein VN040_06090 [Pseudosphingobacterium sp.]|nr:hypothetical protein [Pseudosphingobacterium sp.]